MEAFDGEDDHVHLRYRPKVALSTLVNRLKGASSRVIRKENFPEVTRHLCGAHLWLPKQYVEQQRAPDRERRSK